MGRDVQYPTAGLISGQKLSGGMVMGTGGDPTS